MRCRKEEWVFDHRFDYLCEILSSMCFQAGRPVLFFCKAGKDRTGLVSALLLSVAGCSDDMIVDDYIRCADSSSSSKKPLTILLLISFGRSDSYRQVALAGIEKKPELKGLDRSAFEGAPREAMQDALQYLRLRYGSPAGYMTAIGFGPEQQNRLRALLREPKDRGGRIPFVEKND